MGGSRRPQPYLKNYRQLKNVESEYFQGKNTQIDYPTPI